MHSLPLALALSLALSVPFFPSAAAIPSAAEQTVQAPEPARPETSQCLPSSKEGAPLTYPAKLPVLMYHHVVPDGQACNDMTVTAGRLEQDLRWLAENGYETVLPRELAAGDPLPEKAVLITFDDGYRSNYDYAYPLLQKYRAKAAIAVMVFMPDNWAPGFLSWDMCREMVQSGLVEIGSHTYACHDDGEHGIRRRKGESREDYEARVLPDLQTSIDLIQEKVGTAPIFFAYPNGKTEEWARDFIQAHFAVTVTTRHGPSDIAKGLYDLKRCNVSMGVPVGDILPE